MKLRIQKKSKAKKTSKINLQKKEDANTEKTKLRDTKIFQTEVI